MMASLRDRAQSKRRAGEHISSSVSGQSSGQSNPRGSSSENAKKPRTNLLVILTIAIVSTGCAVRRPFAKAQLIVPHDCIVNIEVQADTECRQNADGTGRMLCYNLKLIKKVGCERVEPNPAHPKDSVLVPEGGVPEPR